VAVPKPECAFKTRACLLRVEAAVWWREASGGWVLASYRLARKPTEAVQNGAVRGWHWIIVHRSCDFVLKQLSL
jgi:hypothetical protein